MKCKECSTIVLEMNQEEAEWLKGLLVGSEVTYNEDKEMKKAFIAALEEPESEG